MERGWVPLWRKVEESAVFQNDALWRLWCLILVRATHKRITVGTRTGSGETLVTLEPGQVLYGRKAFAKTLKCPQGTLPGRIAQLLRIGNITIKPNTHFSIISVVNWDAYIASTNKTQQPDIRQASTRQHIQEGKALKKDQNPAAVAIYQFYAENIINDPSKRSDAIRNITKLLSNGHTKEDLAEAMEEYASRGPYATPFHPNNFFGQKEYYKGFGKYAK